ncbi:MAG: hypothetical protein ORN26_01425 [Candidatus Pacebacteria bacterium]|nr:hypothetical protein [Candidatus Paceibacterota bacterium]
MNNLSIINSNVSASYYVGILAGYTTGSSTIANIFVQGTATSTFNYAGGIIG